MKSFTNHTPGMRGINTTDGTVWIEPGQTLELDPKSIVGDVPDLGKKGARSEADTVDLDALKARVSDLEKENAELTKQIDALTKPADTLDHDADGKKGGAAPAKD